FYYTDTAARLHRKTRAMAQKQKLSYNKRRYPCRLQDAYMHRSHRGMSKDAVRELVTTGCKSGACTLPDAHRLRLQGRPASQKGSAYAEGGGLCGAREVHRSGH